MPTDLIVKDAVLLNQYWSLTTASGALESIPLSGSSKVTPVVIRDTGNPDQFWVFTFEAGALRTLPSTNGSLATVMVVDTALPNQYWSLSVRDGELTTIPQVLQWYLCPYDVTTRDGVLFRRCAMARYMPMMPNADGTSWEEAEILSNSALVKVFAPSEIHQTIQGSPDIFLVPTGEVIIPTSQQVPVQDKCLSLTYTSGEVANTGFVTANLLQMFTIATHEILGPNATNDGVVLGGRMPPKKTVAQIEMALPG